MKKSAPKNKNPIKRQLQHRWGRQCPVCLSGHTKLLPGKTPVPGGGARLQMGPEIHTLVHLMESTIDELMGLARRTKGPGKFEAVEKITELNLLRRRFNAGLARQAAKKKRDEDKHLARMSIRQQEIHILMGPLEARIETLLKLAHEAGEKKKEKYVNELSELNFIRHRLVDESGLSAPEDVEPSGRPAKPFVLLPAVSE